MNELPVVAILIVTYKRYDELKKTMYALQKHLQYPREKLRVIVTDDSSGGNKLNHLSKIKSFKVWGKDGIEIIETPERAGWGGNVNFGLAHIASNHPDVELVFQIEDDYVLRRDLNLGFGAALMQARRNIGMLRYRGTAGMHYIYHQFEADISGYELDYDYGNISYLQIDNASHSLYVYSNGPHLKRVAPRSDNMTHALPAFHEFYGDYPVGKKLGETEESYAHQVKDRMKMGNAPAIAILPDWVRMHFDHIGESWQGSKDDIGG